MVKVEFRLEGLPVLAASLAKLGDAEAADDVLAEAALELERRAKNRAPVDTGRLRSSIGSQREGPLQHSVVAGVHHAPFVEFGTGQRGAGSSQPDDVPGEYQHGPGVGRPSQPYLRPALLEVREILNDPRTWKDLI